MKRTIMHIFTFLGISVLAICLCATFVYAADVGENLISNAGFEDGSWARMLNTVLDNEVFNQGKQSVRLESKETSVYCYSKDISVDTTSIYTLSAYIKTQDVATEGGVCLRLQYLNEEKGNISPMRTLISTSGSHDWEKFTCDIKTFNPGTAYIRVYCYMNANAGGTAWFDDVEFFKSPVPSEFLINGEESISIPLAGQTDTQYTVTLKDINGIEFNYSVNWTTEPQDIKGVSISQDGVLSVTGYADPGIKFDLIATLDGYPEHEARIMVTLLYELTQSDVDNILDMANTYSISELTTTFDSEAYRKALLNMGLDLSGYQDIKTPEAKTYVSSLLVQGRSDSLYDEESFKNTFNSAVVVATVNESCADQDTLVEALEKYQSAIEIDIGSDSVWNSLCTDDKAVAKQHILDDIIKEAPYNDVHKIKDIFQTSVALASINSATWGEVEDLLEANIILNFSEWEYYDRYNDLNDTKKAKVCKAMVGQSFEDIKSIKKAFNDQVKKVNTNAKLNRGSGGGGGGGGRTSATIVVTKPEQEKSETETIVPNKNNTFTFTDIDDVVWAQEAIYELASAGIVEGTGNDLFTPNDNVTKEEFLKMLLECFDLIEENAKSSFSNLDSNAWYYKYIASAEKYGIIEADEIIFETDKDILRWEMAYYIYRVSLIKTPDFNIYDENVVFNDVSTLSDEARKGIEWLQKAKIINGIGDNLFAPYDNATRAEAAVIIHRLNKLQKNK